VRLCNHDFPHERARIVRKICALFCAHICTGFAAIPGIEYRRSDDRHRNRQPWRERPLRTRGGRFPARPRGALTPCLLL
jgi:hypothetical protein